MKSNIKIRNKFQTKENQNNNLISILIFVGHQYISQFLMRIS